ncbi:MAG: serine/threonine protein kinase [Pirellulales bacterium]|nr:serine/threonine protein kinase [Pirellulales bacterium]
MNAGRHERVKELFLKLCDADPATRRATLDRECAGDPSLRAEVESLLAHHSSRTILETAGARTTVAAAAPEKSGPLATLRPLARHMRAGASRNKWVVAAMVTVAAFLLLGGARLHYGIRGALEKLLRDELQTVLDADIAALEVWMCDQEMDAARWARRSELIGPTKDLVAVWRQNSQPGPELLKSPALVAARKVLDPYLQEEGTSGYYIISRSGMVLAAHDDAAVGRRVSPDGIAAIARVFSGEARISRPFPQGTYDTESALASDTPQIAVAAPIRDSDNEPLAVLSLGMRADEQFTRILSVARMGRSGETYAFDDRGVLLSDSRFTDQLKKIGLVPNRPDARAIFHVQLRDPGVDLTAGAKLPSSLAAKQFTHPVSMAIAKEDGVNVRGYRDYRGVLCIGAWKWLPKFDFGVVTEVDYDEAYAPLQYPLLAVRWAALVLAATLVGLIISAWRISRLAGQIGQERQLGPYVLEAEIGRGGMGIVYRARHAMLRRPTAVKLLPPAQTSAESLARFEREAQLASGLTHPNTIEIYDYGCAADGTFYYAMEYVAGITLAELLAVSGAVGAPRAIYLLKQICGSLREAHAAGLVHRDIKPHNIMLCQRGGEADFIKVLDFGLVKNIETPRAAEITATGKLTGTPLYLAPERVTQPQVADPRSDIYAVGAVGYNLVTGRPIFASASDFDVLYQVMNVMPTPPSQIVPDLPPELERLLMRSLAKSPDDRPASMSQVLDELERIEAQLPRWTQADAQAWWRATEGKLLEIGRQTLGAGNDARPAEQATLPLRSPSAKATASKTG